MVLSEDKVQSVFVLSEDKVQSTQRVEGDTLCPAGKPGDGEMCSETSHFLFTLGCTYTFTQLVIYSLTLSMNID